MDKFSVENGTTIASSNTSYPIFQGGQLAGAVSFEHTEVTIPKYLKSIQDTQNASPAIPLKTSSAAVQSSAPP